MLINIKRNVQPSPCRAAKAVPCLMALVAPIVQIESLRSSGVPAVSALG